MGHSVYAASCWFRVMESQQAYLENNQDIRLVPGHAGNPNIT